VVHRDLAALAMIQSLLELTLLLNLWWLRRSFLLGNDSWLNAMRALARTMIGMCSLSCMVTLSPSLPPSLPLSLSGIYSRGVFGFLLPVLIFFSLSGVSVCQDLSVLMVFVSILILYLFITLLCN